MESGSSRRFAHGVASSFAASQSSSNSPPSREPRSWRLRGLDRGAFLCPGDRKFKARAASTHRRAGMKVRVMEYRMKGFPRVRLVTSVLDPSISARDWVPEYHRRWEIERALNEVSGCTKGDSRRKEVSSLSRSPSYDSRQTFKRLRRNGTSLSASRSRGRSSASAASSRGRQGRLSMRALSQARARSPGRRRQPVDAPGQPPGARLDLPGRYRDREVKLLGWKYPKALYLEV